MMMRTDTISVAIEPKLKAEAEQILDDLGLGADEAIRVFYKQVVLRRGLPFELAIPNEATRRAMRDVRRGRGLSRYKDTTKLREKLGL
jgi:DNA-damage-inducible protein J